MIIPGWQFSEVLKHLNHQSGFEQIVPGGLSNIYIYIFQRIGLTLYRSWQLGAQGSNLLSCFNKFKAQIHEKPIKHPQIH